MYNGSRIGFSLRSEFSLPDGSMGENVIIFGVDMSSLCILMRKIYLNSWYRSNIRIWWFYISSRSSIFNFSRSNRKFCLSLHYHGSNSFSFANATKTYKFKAKDSEIHSLSLGNTLGDFSANNMQKTRLNGCVYDFSVDYRAFDTSNINIDKYLMRKHDIK